MEGTSREQREERKERSPSDQHTADPQVLNAKNYGRIVEYKYYRNLRCFSNDLQLIYKLKQS